jgi:hypothetical protein
VSKKTETEEGKGLNPAQNDGKEVNASPAAPTYRPDAWHRVPLRTAEHVRAFQARVIRQAVQGKINSGDCYKYCYASNLLLKSIEVSELERRLAALEKTLPGKK